MKNAVTRILVSVLILCSVGAARTPPPVARVAPVVDDYYGTKVTDPYRWMEEHESAELRTWMEGQSAHARDVLAGLPGRAKLLARIRNLDRAVSDVFAITLVGERAFYFRSNPGDPAPKVYVRDGANGKERLLLDAHTFAKTADNPNIGWIEPSKDGRYLAFSLALSGREWGEIRVIEVASGKLAAEKIDRIWAGDFSSMSWLPDNKSFVYLRFPKLAPGQPPTEKQLRSRTYRHVLGRNANGDGDTAVFGFEVSPDVPVPPESFSIVSWPAGSRYAIGYLATVDVDYGGVYVAPVDSLTKPGVPWRRIAGPEDQVSSAAQIVTHGDNLYVASHKDAARFKVLKVDMAEGDVGNAKLVVPPGRDVIENLAGAKDGVYVQSLDGGLSRLRRVNWDGKIEEVKLPFTGAIRSMSASPFTSGALLRYRSWNQPNEILRTDAAKLTTSNTGWQKAPDVDFSNIEALEVMAVSYDGTLVPLSILVRKDAKRDGNMPTLLDSYGAYGTFGSTLPFFDTTALAWLERGGVLAFAHPRGGGEFGEDWHRAGMKDTKLNTVFDTIACAEYLIEHKFTNPRKLAVSGASAGGIAMGGAITWKPHLFAAAINHSGATDMLRFETTANGPDNIPEFGSVKTEAGFRALHAMSPYANVKDGVAYPAVLLEAGYNDPRVDAWIVGKMAARLQAATSSGKPVLLRVEFDSGHFRGNTDQAAELLADEWSFLLWQFGDPEFQP
jgi:prolyl oligopeptidase